MKATYNFIKYNRQHFFKQNDKIMFQHNYTFMSKHSQIAYQAEINILLLIDPKLCKIISGSSEKVKIMKHTL